MTKQEIANWIRDWMKIHPKCKNLTGMYEDFNDAVYADEYDLTGELTNIILGMRPIEYMSYIPAGMFCKCLKITSINIPNHITSIEELSFAGCENLKGVTIPDSVSLISRQAFVDCNSLKSIVIGNGVTHIDDQVFWDCSNLTRVVISESVSIIGTEVFRGCRSLTNITYLGTKQQWDSIQFGRLWNHLSYIDTIECTDGIIEIN